MKNIIYSITFIFSAHFILGAVQQSARDEITLEVIKSAYESVVEGKYALQGKTWTETRNIFEEKINLLKSLEDDSPGSYLDTLLQVNIWFAKFRFRNGEFMLFIDDLEFIETQIAKNDTSYGVYLSNIEEDVREIRNIFDKNVNNEEDIKFARTIQRIQKIVVSELAKISLVHLYLRGYDEASIYNFDLRLTNPSTVTEMMHLELMGSRFDAAIIWLILHCFQSIIFRKKY